MKLTKLAKTFRSRRSRWRCAADGPWIDAKSIVKVMATKAPKGTMLHLRAEGEDADERGRGAGRRWSSAISTRRLRAKPMPGPLRLTGIAGLAAAMPTARSSRWTRRRAQLCAERRRRARGAGAARGDRSAIERIAALCRWRRPAKRADILEFQLAMLEDDDAVAAGLRRDRRRHARGRRLGEALDAEIAGYEASDDEYFRARAADLEGHPRRGACGAHRRRTAGAAPPGAILFGEDITPTRFLATDWSRRRHRAIARQPGEPCRDAGALARRADGRRAWRGAARRVDGDALLDAEHGRHRARPDAGDVAAISQCAAPPMASAARNAPMASRSSRPRPRTARRCACMINVADPAEVDAIDIATCDGVGLMRTEFLFGTAGLPDEETQYRAYRKVLEWAGGKPVTIRTVDAGGDKPVPGFTVEETQPVPRPARHPPVAGATGDLPRADPRAAARRGARQSEGDVADGRRAGRDTIAPPRCSRDEAAKLAARRRCACDAAARHHGRGAGGGDRAGAFRRRRLLLDRLERSDAICDGGGARQRRRRRI